MHPAKAGGSNPTSFSLCRLCSRLFFAAFFGAGFFWIAPGLADFPPSAVFKLDAATTGLLEIEPLEMVKIDSPASEVPLSEQAFAGSWFQAKKMPLEEDAGASCFSASSGFCDIRIFSGVVLLLSLFAGFVSAMLSADVFFSRSWAISRPLFPKIAWNKPLKTGSVFSPVFWFLFFLPRKVLHSCTTFTICFTSEAFK